MGPSQTQCFTTFVGKQGPKRSRGGQTNISPACLQQDLQVMIKSPSNDEHGTEALVATESRGNIGSTDT